MKEHGLSAMCFTVPVVIDAAAWTDDEIVAKIREFTDINRLPPPASAEAADEFEAVVGCPMPPLLRRIYCEVANGGFGVDSGVVSLTDTGKWFSDEESLFSLHQAMSSAPDFEVNRPPHVMPLVTLGCGIWWCVDLNTPHGSMWGMDPNRNCTHHWFFPEKFTLAEWLIDWLDGNRTFPDAPAVDDCPDC